MADNSDGDTGWCLTSEPVRWRSSGLKAAVSTKKDSDPTSWPEEHGAGRVISLHWRGLQGVMSPEDMQVSGKVKRGSIKGVCRDKDGEFVGLVLSPRRHDGKTVK